MHVLVAMMVSDLAIESYITTNGDPRVHTTSMQIQSKVCVLVATIVSMARLHVNHDQPDQLQSATGSDYHYH